MWSFILLLQQVINFFIYRLFFTDFEQENSIWVSVPKSHNNKKPKIFYVLFSRTFSEVFVFKKAFKQLLRYIGKDNMLKNIPLKSDKNSVPDPHVSLNADTDPCMVVKICACNWKKRIKQTNQIKHVVLQDQILLCINRYILFKFFWSCKYRFCFSVFLVVNLFFPLQCNYEVIYHSIYSKTALLKLKKLQHRVLKFNCYLRTWFTRANKHLSPQWLFAQTCGYFCLKVPRLFLMITNIKLLKIISLQ